MIDSVGDAMGPMQSRRGVAYLSRVGDGREMDWSDEFPESWDDILGEIEREVRGRDGCDEQRGDEVTGIRDDSGSYDGETVQDERMKVVEAMRDGFVQLDIPDASVGVDVMMVSEVLVVEGSVDVLESGEGRIGGNETDVLMSDATSGDRRESASGCDDSRSWFDHLVGELIVFGSSELTGMASDAVQFSFPRRIDSVAPQLVVSDNPDETQAVLRPGYSQGPLLFDADDVFPQSEIGESERVSRASEAVRPAVFENAACVARRLAVISPEETQAMLQPDCSRAPRCDGVCRPCVSMNDCEDLCELSRAKALMSSDAGASGSDVGRETTEHAVRERLPFMRLDVGADHIDIPATASAVRSSEVDCGRMSHEQEISVRVCEEGYEEAATKDMRGSLYYQGYVFATQEAFVLFYVAAAADDRVVRALAASMLSLTEAVRWMSTLRSDLRGRNIPDDTVAAWCGAAARIWEGAARNASTVTTSANENNVQDQEDAPVHLVCRETKGICAIAREGRRLLPVRAPGILMRTVGKVGDVDVVVLNDTGADVSCMSRKEAIRLGLTIDKAPETLQVANPSGMLFEVGGVARGELQFSGIKFEFEAVVLDDLQTEFIVGDDFLRRHGCTLSYCTGSVCYGGVTVKVVEEVDSVSMKIYRLTEGLPVVAAEDVVLESGQRKDFEGRVVLPEGLCRARRFWRFEPLAKAELEYGIFLAPALVRLWDKDTVVVRAASGISQLTTVVIPAGSVVGTIHVVKEGGLEEIRSDATIRTVKIAVPTGEMAAGSNGVGEGEFALHLKRIEGSLPPDMSDKDKQLLLEALEGYKDVLCATKLGSTHVAMFDIDPGEAKPVCHKIQRWAPQEAAAIRTQVDLLLAAGLIEPSDSQWSSRLVCAPKKNEEGVKVDVRVCVDFRDINALCVKDAYPAPNIEATLDQLAGAAWFSSVDLAKGYHQVPLTERAKRICSFRCPSGFFRYTHMPFGVMNAPAVFQRMMDLVLRGLSWVSCMVYMDDVVVYSKSWEDHVRHICEVLQRIREAGLTVSIKKCQFGRKQILFLGYVVSRDGVKPDPTKVQAVRAFTAPESLTELRSFLGLTGQFRKFIRDYGDMARPLQAAVRKAAIPEWRTGKAWTEERQRAFEALKAAVTEDVILAHPRPDRPLLMICDASDQGMGAMLAQMDDEGHERPIAFTSATFFGAARNYTTTEKEGLAVVWAASHFRPYVYGIPTVVVTDHSALTYIMTRGNPPPRIAHWVMDLMQYDFTYVHRKGSHNNVADALSRLKAMMDRTAETDGDQNIKPPAILRRLMTVRPVRTRVGKREKQQETCHGVSGDGEATVGPGDHAGTSAGAQDEEVRNEARMLESTVPTPLPRQVHEVSDGVCQHYELRMESRDFDGLPDAMSVEEFIKLQRSDDDLEAMRQWLHSGQIPGTKSLASWVRARDDDFVLQAGVLKKVEVVKRGREKVLRMLTVLPTSLRHTVLTHYHCHPAHGAHMDSSRTGGRIRAHFWWPRMYSDVVDFCTSCLVCQTLQQRPGKAAKLQAHVSARRPWQYMAIDLLAMPESTQGNKYCMVAMDYFTRYAIVTPIRDKTAVTVTKVLMEKVVLVHGHPEVLLTDNGTEFANDIMRRLCETIGTKKIFTTPYRPQADGMVERFNRTLLRILSCFVDGAQRQWDEVLPYVLYAYNTAVSRATGMSPFTLIFGREPPATVYQDVLDATGQLMSTVDPSMWHADVQEFLSCEFLDELRLKDVEEKANRDRRTNAGRKLPSPLQPGTLVLIANKRALVDGAKAKLSRKHRGLYIVQSVTSPVTVVLRKAGDHTDKTIKLHIDNVEPVRRDRRRHVVLRRSEVDGRYAEDVDDGEEAEEFEVESVQGMKVEDGVLFVKVRWKGYESDDDSWIREEDINCATMIEEFVCSNGTNFLRIK